MVKLAYVGVVGAKAGGLAFCSFSTLSSRRSNSSGISHLDSLVSVYENGCTY